MQELVSEPESLVGIDELVWFGTALDDRVLCSRSEDEDFWTRGCLARLVSEMRANGWFRARMRIGRVPSIDVSGFGAGIFSS